MDRLLVNNTELDLNDRVPFPLNFSIADSKEPNKRKRNYSKEVVIPGTASNMAFFSSAYQLALSTVDNTTLIGFNFDPTVRVKAKYYKEGLLVFNGLLRLNQVTISNGNYSFKCTLFSNFIDLFMKLGDKKISELGWSEYNHLLNRTNVINSFATSVKVEGVDTVNFTAGLPDGFGYHYGLVEYGYTAYSTRSTTDIIPLTYAREIFTKCLEVANLTHESDYLDSAIYKKKLIGFGGGQKISLPSTEVANRRVKFTSTLSNVKEYVYIAVDPDNANRYRYLANNWIDMLATWDGITSTLVHDNFDQYYIDHTDTPAGYYNYITIKKQGLYNLNISHPIEVAFDFGAMSNAGGIFNVKWEVLKNGAVIDSQLVEEGDITTTYANTFTYNSNIQLNVSDVINMRFQVYVDYKLDATIFSGVEPLEISITSSSNFTTDLTSVQATLQDGDIVDISRFMPDMKASTFFEAEMLMANLYFSDPDIYGVIKIEPLNDFYQPTTEFWDITDIVDHSKDINIMPSSKIEGKIYKYQWMKDQDYDNKKYFGYFGIDYGNHWYTVPSTFQVGERVYQLPYAQTVPTDAIFPFVAPRIIDVDIKTGIVKPFKGKPRTYLWNGLKSGSWRLTDTNTATYSDLTTYPSVHHFDNWESPNFDLNWGMPILFDYPATSVTSDNLFTRYHERFVKEMTGRDSKIVELYAKISVNDINSLDFSKSVMWNGVLYRLNQITDFDSNISESTKIELIKIIQANNPVTGTITWTELPTVDIEFSPSDTGTDVGVGFGGVEDILTYSDIFFG
jgi:hypothetical protein